MLHRPVVCIIFLSVLLGAGPASGEEDFSFDLDEFEKKSLEWGGYLELKGEHLDINEKGAFALVDSYLDPRSTLDRLTATLQLGANFNKGMVDFNWLVQAFGRQDQEQWGDNADIFEAYASVKPTPLATVDLGKKVFKWGKGYAWNPVGFIDRPKDPNNPEEALEGYVGAGLDLIKSLSGPLQTVALTTVALPVWRDVNEDFGERGNVNVAAKLYLLYHDVDIDLLCYTGNSRTTRYGLDFSTNLATNFEIHGEIAHVPRQSQRVLNELGNVEIREFADTSYLLGLRYLSENDITAIVEYYHNDDGYTERQQERFFQLVDKADLLFSSRGDDTLFQKAATVSQGAYGQPQSGRNYLYARVTQKEPFDLLYFTPGITAILNLDDESFSLSPEAVYSAFTNWELRLRFSVLGGSRNSEFGEKLSENKLELRARYFF
ncbi:MAG: hypothetical protein ABFS09_04490 [Thermodesulfobacteriota bacterium]